MSAAGEGGDVREVRPWPEGVQPTAEQFADWYVTRPRDEQVRIARSLLDSSEVAARCFMQNHDRLRDDVEWANQRARRYRDAWTSARRRIHPQNFLRGWRAYSAAADSGEGAP